MIKPLSILLSLAVLLSNISCASIVNGSRQDVGISSTPSGATVIIDNQESGTTPLIADLKRKDNHIVKIEMAGFKTYETTLTKKTSGWVWGNLAIGGLIGLAVDAISGGIYKLTPEQIQATLSSDYAAFNTENDLLLLTVVLEPDPNWQKIGNLVRD